MYNNVNWKSGNENLLIQTETSRDRESMNLIVESNVHHQHLPSDADPARAAGVVGVHATSEPHLKTHTVPS